VLFKPWFARNFCAPDDATSSSTDASSTDARRDASVDARARARARAFNRRRIQSRDLKTIVVDRFESRVTD